MSLRSVQISFQLFVLAALYLTGGLVHAEILATPLQLQNRIESEISRIMSGVVATQMAVGTFDVAVRVKVVEAPPENVEKDKGKKEAADESPAGLDLGSVDVREVIESYKREIEALKLFKQEIGHQQEKPEPRFKITHLEVILGMDERYPDSYRQQVQSWLAGRVKMDYGPEAISSVTKIKSAPSPLDVPKRDPEQQKEDAQKEMLKRIFALLPYVIMALSLVITGWLLSSGLKKLGLYGKRSDADAKGQHNTESKETIEKRGDSPNGEPRYDAEGRLLNKPVPKLAETAEKVVYLCLELGARVTEVVRVWLDSTTDANGKIKAAILIDTIIDFKKKENVDAKVRSTLILPFDDELAAAHENTMSEAYRDVGNMTNDQKAELLEKIYWDLLSTRTLGLKAMRRPFDYMGSMDDDTYADFLKSQDDKSQVIALLFADQNKSKHFLEKSNADELERVIFSMTKMAHGESISISTIWNTDAQVRDHVRTVTEQAKNAAVNFSSRVTELLNQVPLMDEIRILRKIAPTLPDGGLAMKAQHLTLAFIDQWKPEFISKLCANASSGEIAQVLYVIPEAKNVVLPLLPERMRIFAEDDLRLMKEDRLALEKGLGQMKARWKKICDKEKINLANVIENGDQEGSFANVG